MTRRDDFIKIYGRSPTEAELKAFIEMIELIKSERQKFGEPLLGWRGRGRLRKLSIGA